MSATPIDAQAIEAFIGRSLQKVGLSATDAARVGALMAEADLIGADAHGVFRLPQYVNRIRAGGISATAEVTVELTGPATARVDGHNAMGHLVMDRATDVAIELAKTTGIGWVGVRGSNHAGPASLYAARPVEHGLVGIYSAVASANHMAMWGSNESLLGTNPLAIGIPAGEEPAMILDIATTVVSYGTVKNHALQGKTMPEGWMVEKSTGEPLTDASRSDEGLLAPIGGYKGSGLALALGLLAGTLNGAAFGRDVVDFNKDETTVTNTGHFILALDVSRFMPLEVFAGEVDRQIRELRASSPLPGVDEVRIPGTERSARFVRRSSEGVPLSAELLQKLNSFAADLGVDPL